MNLTVIVPFRSVADGKTRLAACLSDGARRRWCRWMLERTLALLAGLDVVVVSDDATVSSTVEAMEPNARFVLAEVAGDLNLALDQARRLASGRRLLIIPTDLVTLERPTLDRFLADADTLAIAPDAAGQGTNLLHLPSNAAGQFRFQFGPDSFHKHVAEAARLGRQAIVFRSEQSSFDLDTPKDLFSLDCRYLPDFFPTANI